MSRQVLANLLQWGGQGELVSFAQAFPAPETYPIEALGTAMRDTLLDESSLSYGHIQGEPSLRKGIAGLLHRRGMTVGAEQILITAGAQQAIDVTLRALTVRGDVVLMEEPVYPGALERAVLGGRRVIGIPNHGGTLRPEVLEAACAAHKPRLIYLVPTYSNPTGVSLSRESRDTIVRVAAAHDVIVIEDDTYGFLGYEHSSPPALQSMDRDERVVYITSFSKMLAPGLRLGAVVAPSAMLASLSEAKQSSDLVCSAFMQRALARFLAEGRLESHLRAVTGLYQERRDAMLAALSRHMPHCVWTHPEGGLSLWVDLPHGLIERDFMADALQQGVGIAPGSAFVSRPRLQGAMRLSFGNHSVQRIEDGIAILGRLVSAHMSNRATDRDLDAGAAGPLV